MNNEPIFGQALCCGEAPSFGQHNLHRWQGKLHPGTGFWCNKCNLAISTIGGGVDFALHHWNRLFQPCEVNENRMVEPKLNAPDGYRWAELSMTYRYVGGSADVGSDFILFKTDHPDPLGRGRGLEYIIDGERTLKSLKLMNTRGVEEDFGWLCGKRNVSIYASASWSTDKAAWYRLNIVFNNTAGRTVMQFEKQAGRIGISGFRREI